MAMSEDEIKKRIIANIPDAEIELVDTMGDNDHYNMVIKSSQFNGLSSIKQHQLIYQALGPDMGTTLHALSIKTIPL